jgi:RNA polymerase sigma-70 factor, ECF subfamily
VGALILDAAGIGSAAQVNALIDRCRRGDERAWRTLFDEHFRFVHRTAQRLGIPYAELDDTCQDVFVLAFRRLSTFSQGSFTGWLYRITANVATDRHRRRAFRERVRMLFFLGREIPDPKPTAERALEARDVGRIMASILGAMKPKKREVFVLYELEQRSGEEIAELLDCELDTVWSRLRHARIEFRRIAVKKGFAGQVRGLL